jgi:hypothetical protein
VRFHFIEALARRTAATRGTARRCWKAASPGPSTTTPRAAKACRAAPTHRPAPAAPSPLAELLAHIAGQNRSAFAHRPTPPTPAAAELKALSCFRDTWSKLRVDQQFHQALADEPENAGPLNSALPGAARPAPDARPLAGLPPTLHGYADALHGWSRPSGAARPAPRTSSSANGTRSQASRGETFLAGSSAAAGHRTAPRLRPARRDATLQASAPAAVKHFYPQTGPMSLRYSHEDLFRSLRALEEATFPKLCRNCGRQYEDAAELPGRDPAGAPTTQG